VKELANVAHHPLREGRREAPALGQRPAHRTCGSAWHQGKLDLVPHHDSLAALLIRRGASSAVAGAAWPLEEGAPFPAASDPDRAGSFSAARSDDHRRGLPSDALCTPSHIEGQRCPAMAWCSSPRAAQYEATALRPPSLTRQGPSTAACLETSALLIEPGGALMRLCLEDGGKVLLLRLPCLLTVCIFLSSTASPPTLEMPKATR
jgi:hypothetical protein